MQQTATRLIHPALLTTDKFVTLSTLCCFWCFWCYLCSNIQSRGREKTGLHNDAQPWRKGHTLFLSEQLQTENRKSKTEQKTRVGGGCSISVMYVSMICATWNKLMWFKVGAGSWKLNRNFSLKVLLWGLKEQKKCSENSLSSAHPAIHPDAVLTTGVKLVNQLLEPPYPTPTSLPTLIGAEVN